ncbi:hypothetical protein SUGI_1044860 [Cryptomeria japonica]|nr:hypothetical protein SUGI_1044860 [Cryptomeria japonica]
MIKAFRRGFLPSQVPYRNLNGNDNSGVIVYFKFRSFISIGVEERMESCIELKSVKQFHAHILVSGLHKNTQLATKLVIMYTKLRGLADARLIFDQMYDPPLFLWNILIKENSSKEALALYNRMRQAGVQPDHFTFPLVLKACGKLSDLQTGTLFPGLQ